MRISTYPMQSSRKLTAELRILGIDPGLDRTGWAVVAKQGTADPFLVSSGLLHTGSGLPFPKRLERLFTGMTEIIRTTGPSAVAMEKMFFAKSAASVAQTVQARGVLLLAAGLAGLETAEYSPSAAKAAVTGSGTARKAQMQRMVQVILKLQDPLSPDDVADAAALALTHIRAAPFRAACAAGRLTG
ncbi:MAG: crossover junction endodeoxyribonuclease RuvC [Elusimicrobiaceae bacterium]|nr:crossover junction endodeoxyribonuclease RuvC [Elusimicrobiaceae bacterium]